MLHALVDAHIVFDRVQNALVHSRLSINHHSRIVWVLLLALKRAHPLFSHLGERFRNFLLNFFSLPLFLHLSLLLLAQQGFLTTLVALDIFLKQYYLLVQALDLFLIVFL